MTARQATVRLTVPQLRCVNSALALLQCEVELGDRLHSETLPLVKRTRARVHAALRAAGATP